MFGANPLLGSRENPTIVAGFSAGEYDGPERAAKSLSGGMDITPACVAVILVVSLVFVAALRKGGFRDMIVV